MPHYRCVTRDFSPSEAAEITGVSVTLQRDWRRRGLIAPNDTGKWACFSLTEVISMAVMKSFSDAGMSVQKIRLFGGSAAMPTYWALNRLTGAYNFDPEIPEGDRDPSRWAPRPANDVSSLMRFVVSIPSKDGDPTVFRVPDLNQIPKRLLESKAILCSILDCWALAVRISEAAGGTIFRIERVGEEPASVGEGAE